MKKHKKAYIGMKLWQLLVAGCLGSLFFFILQSTVQTNGRPLVTALFFSGIYFCLLALVYLFGRVRLQKKRKQTELATIITELPHTVYDPIAIPIALCNENGFIVWANKAFKEEFNLPEGKMRTLRSIMGFGLEKLIGDGITRPIVFENEGIIYHIDTVSAKTITP